MGGAVLAGRGRAGNAAGLLADPLRARPSAEARRAVRGMWLRPPRQSRAMPGMRATRRDGDEWHVKCLANHPSNGRIGPGVPVPMAGKNARPTRCERLLFTVPRVLLWGGHSCLARAAVRRHANHPSNPETIP